VAALAARGADGEDPYDIREQMTTTMKEHFGVFRDERQMREGLERLLKLKERCTRLGLRNAGGIFNLDMMRTVELEGMLDLTLCVAQGAIARTESRGAHARTDYPTRDDEHWLKHTMASYTPEGPVLTYRPVTLGFFEPQERVY
jgi:succinate dehydrogenase / fumarate reductase flavoprotein subunit